MRNRFAFLQRAKVAWDYFLKGTNKLLMMHRSSMLLFCLALFLPGCASTGNQVPSNASPPESDFRISSIAKTDVDAITELHMQEALTHLRALMEKLYRRNPREWRKGGNESMEQAVARLFDNGPFVEYQELNSKKGVACIHLALDPEYEGDRVFAFVYGLVTMTYGAYNDKSEFFLFDEMDPQKLYNSARNFEIAAWKLSNARDADGNLLILSNESQGSLQNLSFEREFGKLIANQDMMAKIIAGKTNRSIARIIQNLATAKFLPI